MRSTAELPSLLDTPASWYFNIVASLAANCKGQLVYFACNYSPSMLELCIGWKIGKPHLLTTASLPRDEILHCSCLEEWDITSEVRWSLGDLGRLEIHFARTHFCLCLACHLQKLLGQWVDRRGLGRGWEANLLSLIFSSLPIFSTNTTKFLVCSMVFSFVENIFSGNLNTKMSTRISSPLETRNLIFSDLDTWTAKVTKASACQSRRGVEGLSNGFWAHFWPGWRWSGFRRRVVPWHHLSLSVPLWFGQSQFPLCELKTQSSNHCDHHSTWQLNPRKGKGPVQGHPDKSRLSVAWASN